MDTTSEESWRVILSGKKILTEDEASAILEDILNFRKEHGWRKLPL